MKIRVHNYLLQTGALLALFSIIGYFVYNATTNLRESGIVSGFGFLRNTTGFDIIMHLIPYSAQSTYLQAFFVGLVNTLVLSSLAVISSTIVGFIVGIAKISKNWLIMQVATMYVEVFRNIPLLLQIFFVYYILLHYMPNVQNTVHIAGVFAVNVQGVVLWNQFVIIPELLAMLTALTLYASSYIAENVRGGIVSVDKGQRDAAVALGLTDGLVLRLIVLPQALRVIVPPLTSQYLNIIKNTSLGAAIGYPDLVAVFAGTTLNQTGQAIETIFMTMSVYLLISLGISLAMNWYNNKYVLVGGK